MREPSQAYLEKARQSLSEARAIAQISLYEAAGRAAYLAAYHAAQALTLARTISWVDWPKLLGSGMLAP